MGATNRREPHHEHKIARKRDILIYGSPIEHPEDGPMFPVENFSSKVLHPPTFHVNLDVGHFPRELRKKMEATMEATPETVTGAAETSAPTKVSKRNKLATVTTSDDKRILTWKFSDGSIVEVNIDDLKATHADALAYGYRQKLSDAYAGAESVDEAKGWFNKILDGLKAGSFTIRIAGEPREEPIEVMVDAFILFREKAGAPSNRDRIKAAVEAMDKTKRAALRKQLAVEIAQVRAQREKPAAAIDLLADFS